MSSVFSNLPARSSGITQRVLTGSLLYDRTLTVDQRGLQHNRRACVVRACLAHTSATKPISKHATRHPSRARWVRPTGSGGHLTPTKPIDRANTPLLSYPRTPSGCNANRVMCVCICVCIIRVIDQRCYCSPLSLFVAPFFVCSVRMVFVSLK